MDDSNHADQRRRLLAASGAGLAGLALTGRARAQAQFTPPEVRASAVEDLMQEHGVLRRCLAIFDVAALRLRSGSGVVPAQMLRDGAMLFRTYGEDLHERMQEEQFVLPQISKAVAELAPTAAVLKFQHDRGREITEFVLNTTREGRIGQGDAVPIADALDGFVKMYMYHAALEDTVIFPAWKASLQPDQYRELAARFERLEQQEVGPDGFADAVRRIIAIENAFNLGQLSLWTAPPPPQRTKN